MSAKGLGAEPIAFGHYPTPAHMVTRLWEVCPELRNARAVCDFMADEGALLTTHGHHFDKPIERGFRTKREATERKRAILVEAAAQRWTP